MVIAEFSDTEFGLTVDGLSSAPTANTNMFAETIRVYLGTLRPANHHFVGKYFGSVVTTELSAVDKENLTTFLDGKL